MREFFKYTIIVFLVINAGKPFAFSQPDQKSEEEFKKNAEKLFRARDYAAALPLYSQLLSLYPKDPNYSYRFGACMLYAEKDKEAPLEYLEVAASKPTVDPDAHYFLGQCHHLNYRFNDAISAYERYKELRGPKTKRKQKHQPVEQQIEMCKNGKKLLRNITDLSVIQKKTLSVEDFFRTYDLSSFGGKLIRKPDEFKLAHDKKVGEESILYLQPDAEVLYFSSYGEEGATGKDIYISKKLPNGDWGDMQPIGAPINTPYDEEYPFIHPSGNVIYFASKGHNSMGGYDIFKSYKDMESGKWGTPVNLDFAINTPADDYLYITDMLEKNAYFSSTRESVEGEVTVYRVKTDRIPIDIAVIKGKFISETTKSAKITVEDASTYEMVGIFNTNSKTGDYMLSIPNGGRFKFLVETEDSPVTHSGEVSIPKQKSLQQLKQEIQLIVENGEEKLIIKNKFDEEVEAEEIFLAASVFKEKAALDVNMEELELPEETVEEELTSVKKDTVFETEHADLEWEVEKDTAEIVETAPSETTSEESISNEDIVKMAYDDYDQFLKEAADVKKQVDAAYSVADSKNRQALEKSKQSDELTSSDAQQAREFKKESKQLAEEAVVAYNLARDLEQRSVEKEKNADQALEYATSIETAVTSDSHDEAVTKLDELKTFLESQKQKEDVDFTYNQINQQLEKKSVKASKQAQFAETLKEEADDLEEDIKRLKKEAETAKKKDAERYLKEAAVFERDLPSMREDAEKAAAKTKELQEELLRLEHQESLLSGVVTAIKSTDTATIAQLTDADKNRLKSDIASAEERIEIYEQEEAVETTEEATEPVVSIVTEETAETTEEPAVAIVNTEEPTEFSAKETEATEEEIIPADYKMYFEEKLIEQESAQESAEQQEEIAETYDKWAKKLDDEAFELRIQVELEKKKKVKQELEEQINDLEAEAKRKKEIAEQNRIKGNEIKAEEVTASTTQPEENTETSSTVQRDEATTESTISQSDHYDEIASIAEKYNQTESEAMNIENEYDRAVTLADINEEWAKEIDAQIIDKNVGLDMISDENEKAKTEQVVELLTELADEKNDKAKQYRESAAQLLAAETSEIAQEVDESTEAYFQDKLIEQENAEAGVITEETKADLYEQWAKSIDQEAAGLKAEAETATNEEEKQILEVEIAKLETESVAKLQLAEESKIKAEELKALQTAVAMTEPVEETENIEETVAENTEEVPVDIMENTEEPIVEADVTTAEKTTEETEAPALSTISEEPIEPPLYERIYKQAEVIDQQVSDLETDILEARTDAELTSKKKEKEALLDKVASLERKKDSLQAEKALIVDNVEAAKRAETYNPGVIGSVPELELQNQKAEQFVQEATDLEDEAATLRAEAEIAKKKDAEEKLAEAAGLDEQAAIKRKQAENSTQLADELKKTEERAFKKSLADAAKSDETIPVTTAQIAPVEIESVGNSEEYKAYSKTQKLYKKLFLEAEVQYSEAERLRDEALVETITAETLAAGVDETTPEEDRKRILKEAEVINIQAQEKAAKAEFLEAEAKEKEIIANQKVEENTQLLMGLDKETTQNILAYDYLPDSLKVASTSELAAADTAQSAVSEEVAEVVPAKETASEEIQDSSSESIEEVQPVIEETAETAEKEQPAIEEAETVEEIPVKTTEDPSKETTVETTGIDALPTVLTKTIFVAMDETASAYNANNPIPMDKKLPQGLVFKVQVGAFRNPIPQDQFKGFAPIMGKSAGDGIKRYTVGLFQSLALANDAKDKIRGIGYNDAFVVAFLNDERVSIAEAKRMIASGEIPAPSEEVTTLKTTAETVEISQTKPVETTVTASENAVNATDVASTKELFYTVQIGVYTKPATSAQLFNISPVNSERTESGYIRYSSGKYGNVNEATNAKNRIVQIGIEDAFVTAYFKGKRISVAEARKVATEQSGATISEVETSEQSVETVEEPANVDVSGIIFKVQIGAYSGSVPLDEAQAFLQLSREQKIDSKEEKGLYIYTTGNFSDYAQANTLKEKAVTMGLPDAFVVAFNNGAKMDVNEARKLKGQ